MLSSSSYWEIVDLRELYFTGVQVAYYILCPRKFWLFSNGLSYEHDSERVLLGKLLESYSFPSESRKDEDLSMPIKIDFFRTGDEIVVHEVKLTKPKNDLVKLANELQLKYYIWFLKEILGLKASTGILHYPRARKTVKVNLTQKDYELISDSLQGMRELLKMPSPPLPERKPYCPKCAYYNFCFSE